MNSNTRDIDMVTTPARAMELRNSKYDWGFKVTMVDRPEYTRVEKPHTRGKLLGGCSCLNYFTWVRGSHGTYDDWTKFGGKIWDWDHCEEYFDKVSVCQASSFIVADCYSPPTTTMIANSSTPPWLKWVEKDLWMSLSVT